MEANNNITSSIVVSNDEISKIIKINQNTKIEDFYQKIINVFPPSDNLNFKLFYYEGYSHEKQNITTEEEYVKANKKGIEYFYCCSNNDCINNEIDIDYLKYYSVNIFSPIESLNSEFQNNQRKQMKMQIMQPINNIKNNNNNINNIMINPNLNNIYPLMMRNNTISNIMMMENNMNNHNLVNPFIMMNNIIKNHHISPKMRNNKFIKFEKHIPDFQIIDTEKNPLNKYIENAINLSHTMKKQILKEKQFHPEKFLKISMILSSPGLLSNVVPTYNDYNYILCLIGKILENNGIIVGIYKQNNNKDRVDLSAIQFIFSGLINRKKYRLQFSVDEYTIITVINDLNYRKKFINKWKEIIANRLNLDKNLIILTNPRQRTHLYLDLAFNPQVKVLSHINLMKILAHGEIKSCQMVPLLEGCRLSPNIFDKRYHKFYNFNLNNVNQRRGGEEYIPPLSWTAYGINISDKYDFGNNRWLGNKNIAGEFAVAYYGINNIFNNNFNHAQNLKGLMGNLESGKTFINVNNIRNPGQKCNVGAYFYKNPNYAENSSEKINIGGFEYKIMFMCRINPLKIRQPENFQDCWILSPSSDEVRPYKILIKKIPITPLTIASQQEIKLCLNQPNPIYFQIMQEKDESFYNKKNTGNLNNLSNYDYVLKLYSQGSSINFFLRDPYNQNNQNGPFIFNNDFNNLYDKKSFVWCLHKAITQNYPNVPNDTIVYRGVFFKLPYNIGVGTKFFFPEFLSTSRDINIAKDIASNGTLMIITIQNNGIHGKKFYCRDIEYISDYPEQKEILFTSHCQFRVTRIEKTPALDYLYLICEGHHFQC